MVLVPARAGIFYWDGAATTVNTQSDNATTTTQSWLAGGNWDNGTTSAALASWTSGDSAVFGGTAASQTITAGTFTVGNLTFGQGALGAGTTGTAYTVSSGTLTLSSSTITTHTATTIQSILAGTTGLIKQGAGTLSLTGANTFSGGVAVDAGTLLLGAGHIRSSSPRREALKSRRSSGWRFRPTHEPRPPRAIHHSTLTRHPQ